MVIGWSKVLGELEEWSLLKGRQSCRKEHCFSFLKISKPSAFHSPKGAAENHPFHNGVLFSHVLEMLCMCRWGMKNLIVIIFHAKFLFQCYATA